MIPYKDRQRQQTIARWVIGYRGVTAVAARNGFTITADTGLDDEARRWQATDVGWHQEGPHYQSQFRAMPLLRAG